MTHIGGGKSNYEHHNFFFWLVFRSADVCSRDYAQNNQLRLVAVAYVNFAQTAKFVSSSSSFSRFSNRTLESILEVLLHVRFGLLLSDLQNSSSQCGTVKGTTLNLLIGRCSFSTLARCSLARSIAPSHFEHLHTKLSNSRRNKERKGKKKN
jgi:hypothetical protein